MRLLLVEDSVRLAELIAEALRRQSFAVDHVSIAADAEAAAGTTDYDLIILDLGLPDYDGMDFLKLLRGQRMATLVLVLTARDGTQAVIDGLNGGADDFLCKPFDMNELIARVRALLRRPGKPLGNQLHDGNIVFDTIDRDIRINGLRIDLTRLEASALELLMRSSGRVVSKVALENSLYGFGDETSSNAVEVVLHRLRKKLLSAAASVRIQTLRGVGYVLSGER
jgi:DNA-binding response OmpR family regulator